MKEKRIAFSLAGLVSRHRDRIAAVDPTGRLSINAAQLVTIVLVVMYHAHFVLADYNLSARCFLTLAAFLNPILMPMYFCFAGMSMFSDRGEKFFGFYQITNINLSVIIFDLEFDIHNA